MALFNRKPKSDSVGMPPELQNYYQAENREKTWMAWVLGIATLVITILLALALFFGGRWVYRKVRGNETPQVTTTQTQEEAQEASEDTSSSDDEESSSETEENTVATGSSSTPTSTPSTQTPPAQSTPTPTPTTTAQTGTNGLPSTGPADTLAIFVAVTVLAYVAHRQLAKN
jgi:cytoskeletal protein RodZ